MEATVAWQQQQEQHKSNKNSVIATRVQGEK